jgi:hypothetical protein
LRNVIADTRSVRVDAAFVAIVVAFAAGWLMRRWRGSENEDASGVDLRVQGDWPKQWED